MDASSPSCLLDLTATSSAHRSLMVSLSCLIISFSSPSRSNARACWGAFAAVGDKADGNSSLMTSRSPASEAASKDMVAVMCSRGVRRSYAQNAKKNFSCGFTLLQNAYCELHVYRCTARTSFNRAVAPHPTNLVWLANVLLARRGARSCTAISSRFAFRVALGSPPLPAKAACC